MEITGKYFTGIIGSGYKQLKLLAPLGVAIEKEQAHIPVTPLLLPPWFGRVCSFL